MKRTAFLVTAIAVVVGFAASCSRKESEEKKEYLVLGEYVSATDSLPRVRYFDSNLVTLNDRCAVRQTKLNVKMPAVYVNGQPIGFC